MSENAVKPNRKPSLASGRGQKYQWVVLILLTVLFVFIQYQRLVIPQWDQYEDWRQSDTYSIARNYVQFGMDFLRPQLNYDGVSENYAQLELQIMPFLSAIIFRVFGVTTPVICRILSLLFFLSSALFLYFLMRDFAGSACALFGYGVYLFMPLSMLTASAIQPESCALFFYCGGVYFLRRYQNTHQNRFLVLASVMTAVAIMEKTPVIFVGLVFLYVLITVMGKRFYKNPWFYGCGAITLAPPALYLVYSSIFSKFRFVDGIAAKHIFTEQIFSIFTKSCISFFYRSFTRYFGWAIIVLSVLGMLLLHKKEYRFVLMWTVAFALECATIVAVIQFGYYLVFLLPICAMLAALVVKDLAQYRKTLAVAACCFTVISETLVGIPTWRAKTAENNEMEQTGAFIEANTAFDDGIAIAVLNPSWLNAANRRGYRANIQYYDYIPTGPEEEISYFIEHGVRYFAVVNGSIVNDTDGSYLTFLRENFPVHAESENCTIYDLRSGGIG